MSLELQYYLIAPLLWFILNYRHRRSLVLLILLCSLFLQYLLRGTLIEFPFLFCRLWQFLVGTIVFLFDKPFPNEKSVFSIPLYSSFSGLVLLLFIPEFCTSVYYKFSIRLLATILSGLTIHFGQYFDISFLQKLDTGFTYLGDISYCLYLVHWPVITFAKYIFINSVFYPAIISIFGSIILYEVVDKNALKQKASLVFICTGTLFIIVLLGLFFSTPPKDSNSVTTVSINSKMELNTLIKLNEDYKKSCPDLPIENCHNDSELDQVIPEFIVSLLG